MKPHPVPRFKAINRPRVTELLTATLARGARLLVVQAPQGYGKTTALSLWDQETRSTNDGPLILWVSVRGCSDETTFLQRLCDSLGVRKPSWPELAKWAAEQGSALTLIVDDDEDATSGAHDLWVIRLLNAVPQLGLMVLTSRNTILASSLVTAGLRGSLLGVTDLAFSDEEAMTLTQQLGLSEEDGLEANRGFASWLLGVRAELLALSSGVDRTTARARIVEDLLTGAASSLDAEILTAIASFPGLAPSTFARVIGVDEGTVEASVRRLGELGALLTDSDWGLSALPALCHSLRLTASGWRTLDSDGALAEATARRWEESQPLVALRLLLDRHRFQSAEQLLMRNFMTVVVEGSDALDVLRSAPPAALDECPGLLMARVILERTDASSTVDALRALVQRLRVSARRVLSRPDAPYLVRIEAFLIATERMLGNWEEALELSYDLVRRLEMPQYSGNLESSRGLPIHYSVVSLTGCLAGDYRLAYSAAELAFRAARAQGDLKEESHALGLLALASALQGRIEVAGEHLGVLKQVVSDFSGELDEFSWADAEIAQVVVAASRGDLPRASVHLQRLENGFDRMEQWPLVVWAKAIVTGLFQDQGEAALLIELSFRNRPSSHEVSGHWEGRLLHFAANSALFMGHQGHAAALASRAEEFDPGNRGVELRQALMRHQFAHVVQGVGVAVQEESRPTERLLLLLLGAVAADHLADSERSRAWWKELSEATDPSLAPWLLSDVPYDLYVLADTETGWNNPFADHVVDLDCGLRMRGYKPLTRAECEVLDALASDETIPEVAEELCLSVNKVKSHLQSVYAKLGVAKRGDAVRVARRIGAIPAR